MDCAAPSPASTQDPELGGTVLRLIGELAVEGWTMIIVTHGLEFAREVTFGGGKIVERGYPKQLLRHPAHKRTQQLLHLLLRAF